MGLQGSPSATECVFFLVLFWPWSAQRKKRKKTETSCWSLEGNSGPGGRVLESAGVIVFRDESLTCPSLLLRLRDVKSWDDSETSPQKNTIFSSLQCTGRFVRTELSDLSSTAKKCLRFLSREFIPHLNYKGLSRRCTIDIGPCP